MPPSPINPIVSFVSLMILSLNRHKDIPRNAARTAGLTPALAGAIVSPIR